MPAFAPVLRRRLGIGPCVAPNVAEVLSRSLVWLRISRSVVALGVEEEVRNDDERAAMEPEAVAAPEAMEAFDYVEIST